jgi:hypothetical protein
MKLKPFTIQIDSAILTDLRERIEKTRWPPPLPGIGWQQGTDAAYLRSLATYWVRHYDWRKHERRLNEYPQFLADVSGYSDSFRACARGSGPRDPAATYAWVA